MSRSHFIFLPCLVVGGLLWAPVEQTFAQAPDGTGIVRVSDQPIQGDIQSSPGATSSAQGYCPSCQPGSGSYENYAYYDDSTVCPPYDYVHHGHCSHKLHQILDWFNPHGNCTFSPDHGWAPPAKSPIYRQPVAYQKGFPDSWTGQPGTGQPQYRAAVYMPTDTTQLGYYYQQVPRWQRNPSMIPPRPHPAEWHVPGCTNGSCGRCQKCQSGYQGQIIYEGPQPTEIPSTPPTDEAYPDVPPTPEDVPGINPAVPAEKNPGLERASGTPDLKRIN